MFLDIRQAPKGAKVVDRWLAAMPCLVRRLPDKRFRGSSVERENSSAHRLPPKFSRVSVERVPLPLPFGSAA